MAKICAIGERKIVLGVLCEKQKATTLCLGCYASGPCHCKLTGDMDTAVEDGGRECESDGECTIWRKTAEATPALIAAAWARQAVATLINSADCGRLRTLIHLRYACACCTLL